MATPFSPCRSETVRVREMKEAPLSCVCGDGVSLPILPACLPACPGCSSACLF